MGKSIFGALHGKMKFDKDHYKSEFDRLLKKYLTMLENSLQS